VNTPLQLDRGDIFQYILYELTQQCCKGACVYYGSPITCLHLLIIIYVERRGVIICISYIIILQIRDM
jgi:hypothetical protein